MPAPLLLPRNDPRQYDALVQEWWRPAGAFSMLHSIAKARSALIPPASDSTSLLVDLGCGAGLMAPYVVQKGYRHVGIDVTHSALLQARSHGVSVARGNVMSVPMADECADVVCAGEILEHVTDLSAAIDESCRILRPGGLLVLDTVANTALARLMVVTIAERVPGGAPPGIHDPALFVNRRELVDLYADHGVTLRLRGLRPTAGSLATRIKNKEAPITMRPWRSTSVLFQAWGRKALP